MQIQEIAERWGPTHLMTQRKYKKDYHFASQNTTIANTAKYRRIDKCRSTYNKDHRKLEDAKYLYRTQRTKRDSVYGMIHKSTITTLGMKMYHALARAGYNTVAEIKSLLAKLRFKYPEFAARSTEKMLSAVKPNPQDGEQKQKIFNSLAENLSANR
jgi:hypothetical protein